VAIRRRKTASGAPLLTVRSQTVRILLDAAAHVRGKPTGQMHIDGRVRTSWDRLAGFKSRHPDQGPRSADELFLPGQAVEVRVPFQPCRAARVQVADRVVQGGQAEGLPVIVDPEDRPRLATQPRGCPGRPRPRKVTIPGNYPREIRTTELVS
jgi:hypothetical protein